MAFEARNIVSSHRDYFSALTFFHGMLCIAERSLVIILKLHLRYHSSSNAVELNNPRQNDVKPAIDGAL